jgi:hypothetical protein
MRIKTVEFLLFCLIFGVSMGIGRTGGCESTQEFIMGKFNSLTEKPYDYTEEISINFTQSSSRTVSSSEFDRKNKPKISDELKKQDKTCEELETNNNADKAENKNCDQISTRLASPLTENQTLSQETKKDPEN